MCKLLGVTRSLVYYKRKNKRVDVGIEKHIIEIFKTAKNEDEKKKNEKYVFERKNGNI